MPSHEDYPYLRAIGQMRGHTPDRITHDLERARANNAPQHATHAREDGTWATTDDLIDPHSRHQLGLPALPITTRDFVPQLIEAVATSPSLTHTYGLTSARNDGADTIVVNFSTGRTATLRVTLNQPAPASPCACAHGAPWEAAPAQDECTLIGTLNADGRTYDAHPFRWDGYPAQMLPRISHFLHGVYGGRTQDFLAGLRPVFLTETQHISCALDMPADGPADWMYLFTADHATLRVFYHAPPRKWVPYKDFPVADLFLVDPASLEA